MLFVCLSDDNRMHCVKQDISLPCWQPVGTCVFVALFNIIYVLDTGMMAGCKLRVAVYSPDIPGSSIDFTYFTDLELTLLQSHHPGENAAHFLQLKPFTPHQFSFSLVPITAGWIERCGFKLAQGFYT